MVGTMGVWMEAPDMDEGDVGHIFMVEWTQNPFPILKAPILNQRPQQEPSTCRGSVP